MKTSKSLLIRAKEGRKSEAWFKLVRIYEPLIASWLRRSDIDEADILDLTQEVLLTISTRITIFNHNGRPGAFRNWLRKISINRVRRHWSQRKKRVPLADASEKTDLIELISDPVDEDSKRWEREHDRFVLEKILQFVALEFDARTMQVFRRATINEEPASKIAQDLNVTVGQVYKYKYRVMKRLLEESQGLVDADTGSRATGSNTGLLSNLISTLKNTA